MVCLATGCLCFICRRGPMRGLSSLEKVGLSSSCETSSSHLPAMPDNLTDHLSFFVGNKYFENTVKCYSASCPRLLLCGGVKGRTASNNRCYSLSHHPRNSYAPGRFVLNSGLFGSKRSLNLERRGRFSSLFAFFRRTHSGRGSGFCFGRVGLGTRGRDG